MQHRFDGATAIGPHAIAKANGAFAISLTKDPKDPCQVEFQPDGTVDVPSGCSLEETATAAAEVMFEAFKYHYVKPAMQQEIIARLIFVALRASVLNPLDKMSR